MRFWGVQRKFLAKIRFKRCEKSICLSPQESRDPLAGSFPACMDEFGLFVPVLQKRSSLRASLHGQYEHPASDFPMAWGIVSRDTNRDLSARNHTDLGRKSVPGLKLCLLCSF